MKEEHIELSERKKLILKAIIDAHIENGEPVGSKFLTQNKQIAYSSATIRNEMAELEEMGLLEQPHTSAGRIPSELGYRFYVDSLVDRYNLTQNELAELKRLVLSKQTELDNILQLLPGFKFPFPAVNLSLLLQENILKSVNHNFRNTIFFQKFFQNI